MNGAFVEVCLQVPPLEAQDPRGQDGQQAAGRAWQGVGLTELVCGKGYVSSPGRLLTLWVHPTTRTGGDLPLTGVWQVLPQELGQHMAFWAHSSLV